MSIAAALGRATIWMSGAIVPVGVHAHPSPPQSSDRLVFPASMFAVASADTAWSGGSDSPTPSGTTGGGDHRSVEAAFADELRRQYDRLPMSVRGVLGCLEAELDPDAVVPRRGPPAVYVPQQSGCGRVALAPSAWRQLDNARIQIVAAHEGWLGHHGYSVVVHRAHPNRTLHPRLSEAWAFLAEAVGKEAGWFDAAGEVLVLRHRAALVRAAAMEYGNGLAGAPQTLALLLALEQMYREELGSNRDPVDAAWSVLETISGEDFGGFLQAALDRRLSEANALRPVRQDWLRVERSRFARGR